ncbi:MAG: hypothetical protein JST16_18545 [Bdellovibrionales bacterium]|nr:hypothetical protein [Bdellovibrionales bacterium]
MTWTSFFRPLLVGLFAGGICVGGLQWGVKLLLEAQANPEMPAGQRRRKLFLAGILLIGQLLVALALLLKSGAAAQNPMALGIGLVGSILVFSLLGKTEK